MLISQFFIDFPSNSEGGGGGVLHIIAQCLMFDFSCADYDGVGDDVWDFSWEDFFKFGTSATATEFCERVQVGINDVYIPHCKY